MNAAHQLVSLDKATPGMTLSDAILDQQGKILLPEGTVLTESTIASLGRHDITTLPITVSGAVAPVIDECAITARLAHLFRGDAAGTANTLLHQYIVDYRLEHEAAP